MAATVIAIYSTEVAANLPPLYAPLTPRQREGRLRVATFNKTFATDAVGSIALCVLPAQARILNGEFIFSATLGGTTTWAVGLAAKDGSGFLDVAGVVSDNTAALFAATALASTAKQVLAATVALSYGYDTEKELYVTGTWAAAAMGTQVLKGHIVYVVD
jgi:hypothetical protein